MSYTYPVKQPTGTLTTAQLHLLLQNNKVIAKRVADLSQMKLIADWLLPARFDATGGGKLSGQILTAMEAAAVRKMTTYSRYGSDTFKQVYIYGALDLSPTSFSARSFGLTWGLGGFLLTPFMAKAGMETVGRMRKRVIDELTTTFKSHYSHEISLTEALNLDTAHAYNAKRTGEKYLLKPHG